jgi:5'-nucleotidase
MPGLSSLALLLLSLAAPREATVLYFNDGHQIMPVVDRWGERGGVARLKTLVDRERRERPGTVAVFGGDLAGGTLFGGVFQGFPMIEAFNRLPLDLASFGQHDFDFGADVTARLVAASRFPWITTNLTEGGKPFAGLPTFAVKEAGGLRIGFLGLTDAMATTFQEGRVVQRDLVEAAREAAARLERVDAVVAVTQADLDVNERLLREIPAIDAILTEEEAEDRSVVRWIGGRPIAAPAGNLGSIIRLDLKKTGDEITLAVRVLPVDASVPADPALAALEREYAAKLTAALAEPVAELATPLPLEGARTGESALGNLVADAYRAHHRADIGLVNGGGLRAGLAAGRLTLADTTAVLPFGNRVSLLRMTGAQIREALEHGLSGIERQAGAFLQVSGLAYEFDPSQPPGKRLLAVTVGGNPLEPNRAYTVALSSHLATGGDGFEVFRRATVLVAPAEAPLDATVLSEYLRRLGKSGAARGGVEGRVRLVPPSPLGEGG